MRSGQLGDILAAIVEMIAGDQRDRRFEDRTAPMQRALGCLFGSPTLDILLGVQAAARILRIRKRPDQATANIGVERGHADSEAFCGLSCREHILILSSILTLLIRYDA